MQHVDPRRTRLAALAGACGATVFFLVATALTLLRPDVDLNRHFLSELAYGPGGHLAMGALILNGLGIVTLATGMTRTFSPPAGRRELALLVAVGGLGTLLAGIFPTTPRGQPLTETGITHAVVAGIALSATVAAALLLAYIARHDPRWQSRQHLVRLLACLVVGTYVLYMALFAAHWLDLVAARDIIGLTQRLAVGAGIVWLLAVSAWTWEDAGAPNPPAALPVAAESPT